MDSREQAEKACARLRDAITPEHRKYFGKLVRTVGNSQSEIFNFYEARFTNGPLERMNRAINDISSADYSCDFEILRYKALLRYGNLVPLGDLAMFETGKISREERRELANIPVVQGFDLSTLARSLRRGAF